MPWWRYCLVALVGITAHAPVSKANDGLQKPLPAGQTSGSKPNIVFILTDDQDLHMDSLSYMPYLRTHLIDEGTFFQRHYCTIALCCPSRVSLWTGRAAHNTNVTDVNPPYGRYALSKSYSPKLTRQAVTQSSSARGSMKHGSLSGSKMPATTPIILGSYLILTH